VSALLITGAGPYSVDHWFAEQVRTAKQVAKREAGPTAEREPVEESVTDD